MAEVFGDEVARDIVGQGMLYAGYSFESVVQGFVVTKVGDDGMVTFIGIGENAVCGFSECLLKYGHSCSGHGGDMYILLGLLAVIKEGRVGHDEVALVYYAQNNGKVRSFGRVRNADVWKILVGF